jgi:putative flippase GtrA
MGRFAAFNLVGVLGFVLQLGVLALLLHAGIHYLLATALAVEAAVLHNFAWHERWTWRDRPVSGRARLHRLVRFHASNGIVSLLGNLVLMRMLVGVLGVPPLPANLVSVLACSLLNFTTSDRLVFRPRGSRRAGRRTGGQSFATAAADRNVSATNVNVAFVQPPVGRVGDPTTNRFS